MWKIVKRVSTLTYLLEVGVGRGPRKSPNMREEARPKSQHRATSARVSARCSWQQRRVRGRSEAAARPSADLRKNFPRVAKQ